MKNKYFDEAALSVLLEPWDWKIVSSLFPPDSPPVGKSRYEEWLEKNNHRHPHREIMFALEGETYYSLNNRAYACSPGTLFFFNSMDTHDFYYPPFSPDITHLWISFVQDGIFARTYAVNKKKFDPARSRSIIMSCTDAGAILNRCWTELAANPDIPLQLKRNKILTAAGLMIVRLVECGFSQGDDNKNLGLHKKTIDTISSHISETGGRNMNLEKLAHISGYSKFHFARMFRKHTGHTVHAYIDICRRKKFEDLQKKGLRKKEISEELGFSCPAAFSRWLGKLS